MFVPTELVLRERGCMNEIDFFHSISKLDSERLALLQLWMISVAQPVPLLARLCLSFFPVGSQASHLLLLGSSANRVCLLPFSSYPCHPLVLPRRRCPVSFYPELSEKKSKLKIWLLTLANLSQSLKTLHSKWAGGRK